MNNVFTVELPIAAKDVFRLLALRCITETPDLFSKIRDNFDYIYSGINTTPRLDESEFGRKPFAYKHEGLDIAETVYERMTERQLCAAKNAFFGKPFDHIGEVVDYELPLDDKKDSAFGKVDLVSIKDDTMFLLEVKKCESNEHPLRAMFEIFTFWRTLASEDGSYNRFLDAYRASHEIADNVRRIVPALLLCKSSEIMKELETGLKRDGVQRELCGLFFGPRIGMRVFSYSKDDLSIKEETADIKKCLASIRKDGLQ